MKLNFNSIFVTFAVFAMALSCSKVEELGNGSILGEDNVVTGEPVTISATLSDNMTKVSFTPEYENGKPQSLALAWEAGDKLRIYNHADKTQYEDFELSAESEGKKTGNFTGVLPVADSYDVEVVCGDVDYAVQVQPADGVTSSLKYLATISDVADVKALTFTEFSSVLAITAKLPEGVAAVVGSVDITASEAIFNAGNTLTISLTEKGDAGNDGILHLFANLPKGSQSVAEGTTLLMHFNAPDTDHTVYTRYVELGASAFTAGKLNTINVNASQSDKHAGSADFDGTSEDKPYLIADKYQFHAVNSLMAQDATTYFRLLTDVDLENAAWTVIDAAGGVSFDGDGHKISNVTAGSGFFSTLAGNVQDLTIDTATISAELEGGLGVLANVAAENVTVKNVTILNSTLSNAKDYTGGLIGKMTSGVVEDVNVACAVTNTAAHTGGLIGNMEDGTLKNCVASGDVTSNYYYAGGLVGYAATATLVDCQATGKVISNRTNYARTGGLVGEIHGGSVTGCHAAGDVDIKGAYAGGLIGVVDGTMTVSASYATGAVAQLNEKNYNGVLIGWITPASNVAVSNCYTSGKVSGKNYCGGFVGYVQGVTSITNCFSNSEIDAAKWSGCVFGGNVAPKDNLTLTGFIGWNVSNRVAFWYNQTEALEGNYMGTEGTISAKAKEFGWSETIWDLSGEEPRLKP